MQLSQVMLQNEGHKITTVEDYRNSNLLIEI